jgi:signal transduction histidine kinase
MVAGEDSGVYLPVHARVEEPPGGLPPLPAAVEAAAYRIALEALTNVYRHAQAKCCIVRFSFSAAEADAAPAAPGEASKSLLLEICDDGSGLPESYKPGVGLNSMKERAEEVGGECIIEPLPEGGTRVKARFPI